MRRVVRLLTATLLCAALSQTVLAQSGETLDRHRLVLENLQASVDNLGTDSSASLDALEAAASTMRLVARDTDSTTLVPALEQAFSNARSAIANQSRTDLAVQAAVLRGGFQRSLLEAALASDGLQEARAGFSQLAAELELDEGTRAAVAEADSLQLLLAYYRAGLSRSIAALLGTVQDQFPTSQADAYITLAEAYGRSLSIQDAAEVPADLNASFTQLIGAVVEADAGLVATASSELAGQLNVSAELFSEQATEAEQPAAAPAEPAEAAAVVSEEETGTEAAVTPAPEQPEAAAAPEPEPAGQPEAAAPEQPLDDIVTPADAETTEPEAVSTADLTALRAELALEQEQLAAEALINDLGRRGLRGQAGENLARQLHSRGFSSVAEVLATSLELAGRATDATSVGDQAAARQHLNQLDNHYRTNVTALAARMNPAQDELIRDLLGSLQGPAALAVADLQALSGQLASLGSSSQAGVQRNVQALTATYASGWPRQLLVIVTALLAAVPLVLLRMAFGNTNRNWTLIGTGLLLLLVPLFLSALAALLDLAGQLTVTPVLHEIAAWLSLTGAVQQIVVVLIQLLAVVLLGMGTYGICRQFGLFGGVEGSRRRSRSADQSATRTETRTLVDWDEEF